MRRIDVFGITNGFSAKEVFPVLSNFSLYQKYSDVVREVVILEESEKGSVSNWEVNFRNGILRWKEKDLFFPEKNFIQFEQIEGDADHFSGAWSLKDTKAGCEIHFTAQFDMGIPSLAEIIDPIAEQALTFNIQEILKGILQGEIKFSEFPNLLEEDYVEIP